MAAPEFVKMTASNWASDENVIKMMAFSFNSSLSCCIHVSVNRVSIGSDNGLPPIRRQAII